MPHAPLAAQPERPLQIGRRNPRHGRKASHTYVLRQAFATFYYASMLRWVSDLTKPHEHAGKLGEFDRALARLVHKKQPTQAEADALGR